MTQGYIIRDVLTGKYWSGEGWTENRDEAEVFGYRYFAVLACTGLGDGETTSCRVERY